MTRTCTPDTRTQLERRIERELGSTAKYEAVGVSKAEVLAELRKPMVEFACLNGLDLRGASDDVLWPFALRLLVIAITDPRSVPESREEWNDLLNDSAIQAMCGLFGGMETAA